jgi:hypothetical protein
MIRADGLSDKFKEIILKEAKSSKEEKKKRAQAGQEYIGVFWKEMQNLSRKARECKIELKNKGVNGDDDDIDMEGKGTTSRRKRQERKQREREARKAKWKSNRGGDDDDDGGDDQKKPKRHDDDDDVLSQIELGSAGGQVQQMSDKEAVFMEQVKQAMEDEDQMLQQISRALSDLHELALQINKNLKISEALIEELDMKMDKVQDRFDTANSRLAELLEENGGLTRWCPFLIGAMVIVALLGYMFKFF